MSSHKLALSPDLSFPTDAVTQRFGFLGRIGSGKSYAATKLAELMLDIQAQVIAIDPVGVWYGLRVDGKGKGYDIPVFGGLRGDLPLEPTGGALIADLVVDRALSCVIDVSQFATDADKSRFAAAFAERFYFRKKAKPSAIHLFLEECQEFVPQNPGRGEEMMLHHFTRMAKLGRNFGIGLSLITQRPQEVNKKVLNLTECLFAFQMTGSHERKAIREWVASKGANEDIVDILPTLPVGRAHVYSPQWLQISRQIKTYEKRSADVSSTPVVGASIAQAKPLTPVDVEALRGRMAETLERAKADDPKELRREIAALRKQLAAPTRGSETIVSHKVMASQINAAVAAAVKPYRAKLSALQRLVPAVARLVAALADQSNALAKESADDVAESIVRQDMQAALTPQATGRVQRARSATRPAVASQPIEGLKTGQQKILNALAEFETLGVTSPGRHQLGMMAGYNLTGGTGAQHVADLAKEGLVDAGGGVVTLTDAGRAAAVSDDAPSTLAELHERVLRKLPDGQRKIAEYLIGIHPDSMSRADLGAEVGYNLTGGTGAQHVADLVTVGAAKLPKKGLVVASDLLFPEGLR